MSNKIVQEHNEVKQLHELEHYESHPQRTESSEFRQIKKQMHEEGCKCFVDNGYCVGQIEIHHSIIEYSASTEVDWELVKKDFPNFDHVDDKDQMMPLCYKHHQGKYTGIHKISYPIWILQKYMLKDALADFEKAVKEQIKKDEESK